MQVTSSSTTLDERPKHDLITQQVSLLVTMSEPNSLTFLIQASASLAEIWFIGRLSSLFLAAIASIATTRAHPKSVGRCHNPNKSNRSCATECILCRSGLYAGVWRYHDGCA